MPSETAHQAWLDSFLARHDGVAGTVHVERDGDLFLTADRNIPPRLAAIVAVVPRGKGMAGVAQVERRAVQTCNLQADDGGPILPAAREAGGAAAAAVPVFDAEALYGVVGITFRFDGEIGAELLAELESDVAGLPTAGPRPGL